LQITHFFSDFDKAIRLLESKLPLSNNFNHNLNTSGAFTQQGFVIPASYYKYLLQNFCMIVNYLTQLLTIYIRELEEQLAEAYFKRAQAKLMIDNSSGDSEENNNAVHYRAALSDALKVSGTLLLHFPYSY